MRMKKQFIVALVACVVATQAFAAWEWELSAKRYMGMNAFERAQYTKAKKQCEAKQYRAAAAEFEKFKVQFPDSEALSYVLFMRGYSLHRAKETWFNQRDYHMNKLRWLDFSQQKPDSMGDSKGH